MKYMVKSKILATFCAGLLTVSTGIQAAERLATGTQQKQAQKTVIETSPVGLRILSSSTCVGLRYGRMANNSGFSRQEGAHASLL